MLYSVTFQCGIIKPPSKNAGEKPGIESLSAEVELRGRVRSAYQAEPVQWPCSLTQYSTFTMVVRKEKLRDMWHKIAEANSLHAKHLRTITL